MGIKAARENGIEVSRADNLVYAQKCGETVGSRQVALRHGAGYKTSVP
jgi:hypothetical protein